ETKAVLGGTFRSYWSAAAPITPTLLFAHTETFRADNLDAGRSSQTIAWSGKQLTVDFAANGGRPALTMAAVNWAPFQYDAVANRWSAVPIETYWDELERRYASEPGQPADSTLAEGNQVVAQLFYLMLYKGVSNLTERGGLVPQDISNLSDARLSTQLQIY